MSDSTWFFHDIVSIMHKIHKQRRKSNTEFKLNNVEEDFKKCYRKNRKKLSMQVRKSLKKRDCWLKDLQQKISHQS